MSNTSGIGNLGDVRTFANQDGGDLVLDFGTREFTILDFSKSDLDSDEFIL